MKRALLLLLVAATASANPRRVVSNRRGFSPEGIYKVPRGNGPSEGPADAPITIVMWSDFACGFCNRAQTQLEQLKRLYPGQLRFVHRTLPLDDDNLVTAEAALAAGAQGRFRPMSDRLYGVSGHIDRAGIELFARELGLDMVRFRADLDTGAHRAQVKADMDDARTLGISGTPMFFINGRPISGSQSLKVYVEVVDAELARARAAHSTGELYDALVADGRPRADVEDVEKTHRELDSSTVYKVGLGLPGHQIGRDDALVTIVEWSDFQCPFCAKQAPVLAHVRDKYKTDVRIIYRHLPMAFHRQASLAAEAAVAAADQGKFWAFHDQIWANFGHLARADLEQYAEAIQLDMPAFRAALDDRRYHDLVQSEGADAIALGVDGTPTLFVNGKPLIGSHDADKLDAAIDVALDAARASMRAGLAPIDYYAVVMSGASGEERADPSTLPIVSTVHFELPSEERGRAVAAACRRRDGARAMKLGANLSPEVARRIRLVCAGEGIDLR
jgi:protein-disulfide isomerase